MRLRLRTQPLPHPFASEPASAQEFWGEVRLVYENNDQKIDLLRHEWDLLKLGEWLTEEGCRFMATALPEEPRDGESLAEALQRMGQRSDDSFVDETESDRWFEKALCISECALLEVCVEGRERP